MEEYVSLKKKIASELLGSYFYVFAVTAGFVVDELTKELRHVGVAILAGSIKTALIYAFIHISGAHNNPVTSISNMILKKLHPKVTMIYIVTQCIGAILASVTVLLLFGKIDDLGATLPKGSSTQSFILEVILTFLLVIVILCSSVHKRANKSFGPIAVGLVIGLETMFAGPICGASMNPARSLGPAIVSGNLSHLWIYIVAPILGAVIATYVYKSVLE